MASSQSLPDLSKKFRAATWIWTPESEGINNTAVFPAGSRAFRRWHTSPDKPVSSAQIVMSCDDSFVLYINGNQVGGAGGSWKRAQLFNVALAPGQNLFAVNATNARGTRAPNPAGLLAAIQINFADGTSPEFFASDASWRTVTSSTPADFASTSLADTAWVPARILAPYGASPWSTGVALPSGVSGNPTPTSTNQGTSKMRPTNTSPNMSPTGTNIGLIVGASVGGIALVAFILFILLFIRGRRAKRKLSISDSSDSSSDSERGTTETRNLVPFPAALPQPAHRYQYHLGSFGQEKHQDSHRVAQTISRGASLSASGSRDDAMFWDRETVLPTYEMCQDEPPGVVKNNWHRP